MITPDFNDFERFLIFFDVFVGRWFTCITIVSCHKKSGRKNHWCTWVGRIWLLLFNEFYWPFHNRIICTDVETDHNWFCRRNEKGGWVILKFEEHVQGFNYSCYLLLLLLLPLPPPLLLELEDYLIHLCNMCTSCFISHLPYILAVR